jgi:hypothetical protein
MTIQEARDFVGTQLACIERQNPDKELRPWMRDACPAALEHWGKTQQRIALSHPNPQRLACCGSLNLTLPERSEAQKRAAEANGLRLAAGRAQARAFPIAESTI